MKSLFYISIVLLSIIFVQDTTTSKSKKKEAQDTSDLDSILKRLNQYQEQLKAVRVREVCQPPFFYLVDKCLVVSNETETWDGGKDSCSKMNSKLLEIKSENLKRIPLDTISQNQKESLYWIGELIKGDENFSGPDNSDSNRLRNRMAKENNNKGNETSKDLKDKQSGATQNDQNNEDDEEEIGKKMTTDYERKMTNIENKELRSKNDEEPIEKDESKKIATNNEKNNENKQKDRIDRKQTNEKKEDESSENEISEDGSSEDDSSEDDSSEDKIKSREKDKDQKNDKMERRSMKQKENYDDKKKQENKAKISNIEDKDLKENNNNENKNKENKSKENESDKKELKEKSNDEKKKLEYKEKENNREDKDKKERNNEKNKRRGNKSKENYEKENNEDNKVNINKSEQKEKKETDKNKSEEQVKRATYNNSVPNNNNKTLSNENEIEDEKDKSDVKVKHENKSQDEPKDKKKDKKETEEKENDDNKEMKNKKENSEQGYREDYSVDIGLNSKSNDHERKAKKTDENKMDDKADKVYKSKLDIDSTEKSETTGKKDKKGDDELLKSDRHKEAGQQDMKDPGAEKTKHKEKTNKEKDEKHKTRGQRKEDEKQNGKESNEDSNQMKSHGNDLNDVKTYFPRNDMKVDNNNNNQPKKRVSKIEENKVGQDNEQRNIIEKKLEKKDEKSDMANKPQPSVKVPEKNRESQTDKNSAESSKINLSEEKEFIKDEKEKGLSKIDKNSGKPSKIFKDRSAEKENDINDSSKEKYQSSHKRKDKIRTGKKDRMASNKPRDKNIQQNEEKNQGDLKEKKNQQKEKDKSKKINKYLETLDMGHDKTNRKKNGDNKEKKVPQTSHKEKDKNMQAKTDRHSNVSKYKEPKSVEENEANKVDKTVEKSKPNKNQDLKNEEQTKKRNRRESNRPIKKNKPKKKETTKQQNKFNIEAKILNDTSKNKVNDKPDLPNSKNDAKLGMMTIKEANPKSISFELDTTKTDGAVKTVEKITNYKPMIKKKVLVKKGRQVELKFHKKGLQMTEKEREHSNGANRVNNKKMVEKYKNKKSGNKKEGSKKKGKPKNKYTKMNKEKPGLDIHTKKGDNQKDIKKGIKNEKKTKDQITKSKRKKREDMKIIQKGGNLKNRETENNTEVPIKTREKRDAKIEIEMKEMIHVVDEEKRKQTKHDYESSSVIRKTRELDDKLVKAMKLKDKQAHEKYIFYNNNEEHKKQTKQYHKFSSSIRERRYANLILLEDKHNEVMELKYKDLNKNKNHYKSEDGSKKQIKQETESLNTMRERREANSIKLEDKYNKLFKLKDKHDANKLENHYKDEEKEVEKRSLINSRKKRQESNGNKKCSGITIDRPPKAREEDCGVKHLALCEKSQTGKEKGPRFMNGLISSEEKQTKFRVDSTKKSDVKVKPNSRFRAAMNEGQKFVEFWKQQSQKSHPDVNQKIPISIRRHSQFQGPFINDTYKLSEIALAGMETLRLLESEKHGKSSPNSIFRIGGHSTSRQSPNFSNEELPQVKDCPPTPACDLELHYRTIEGSCNNIRELKMGMRRTPFQRILENDYADGFNSLRASKLGGPLPPARRVSVKTLRQNDVPSKRVNNLFVQFGQFIDHDISQAPIHVKEDGTFFSCCDNPNTGADINSIQCAGIEIDQDDPFWKNRKCLSFVRSQSAPGLDCKPGPTQQMNQMTHWLDSSQVYGNRDQDAKQLRELKDGLLKTSPGLNGKKPFLPLDANDKNCGSQGCFLAGDQRVNEQPLLTIIQTFFAREHNKVALELKRINKNWSDETLYQEAKRVVNAEYQHIVYNEYVPILLGDQFMQSFNLKPNLQSPFSVDYNQNVDGRLTTEFAVAGFRVGHTMVPKTVDGHDPATGNKIGEFTLRRVFFNADVLQSQGRFEELLKGMLLQTSQEVDINIVEDLQNFLFSTNINTGLDLISINIQRGRDHGVPGYVEYCKACNKMQINSFEDLNQVMSDESIQMLKAIYKHVNDIDLFIGMLHEKKDLNDAIMGKTFRCIVGDQFARLKRGDRFFYSHKEQVGSFNENQLRQIMKTTLARIICENSDGITEVQKLAFQLPNKDNNPLQRCTSYEKLDLSPWTDGVSQNRLLGNHEHTDGRGKPTGDPGSDDQNLNNRPPGNNNTPSDNNNNKPPDNKNRPPDNNNRPPADSDNSPGSDRKWTDHIKSLNSENMYKKYE